MKLFIATVLALGLSTSAYAGDISCQGQWNDDFDLQLNGLLITDWIKDAVATVTNSAGEVQVGRAAELNKDEKYTPRKYKNHSRFDLSHLIDTENFGTYTPNGTCYISVLIPNNAMAKNSFEAPATINCEQSGGSITLTCEHDRSDDN